VTVRNRQGELTKVIGKNEETNTAEQLENCVSDLFVAKPLPVGINILLPARSLRETCFALCKVAPYKRRTADSQDGLSFHQTQCIEGFIV